jgi:hypothetical protein
MQFVLTVAVKIDCRFTAPDGRDVLTLRAAVALLHDQLVQPHQPNRRDQPGATCMLNARVDWCIRH